MIKLLGGRCYGTDPLDPQDGGLIMGIHKITQAKFHRALRDRVTWHNSTRHLYCGWETGRYCLTGKLPEGWRNDLRLLGRVFIVYSYDTPIAWWCRGVWTVPKVTYSRTTTRHQGVLALAVRDGDSTNSDQTGH